MKHFIVALALSALAVQANIVTLRPAADTSLFETDPTNNFGSSKALPAGATRMGFRGRVLLRFDLTRNVPSNAVITAASLLVKVVATPSAPVNSTFELHRMLQPWVEGSHPNVSADQHGVPAAAGESTWKARLAPGTLWASAGGAAGIDFSTNVSAATPIQRSGSYTFASSTNLVADVQDWLLHPTNNFGWMLLTAKESSPDTARRFGSREDSVNSPFLTITFSLPSAAVAPELGSITRATDTFSFSFTAQANQAYVVEFKDALHAASWQTLTNLSAPPNSAPVTISDPLSSNLQRFFRVRSP